MARKSTSSRKSGEEPGVAASDESSGLSGSQESQERTTPADETPPSKTRAKAPEDQASPGGVGLGDIRKAVAFANSVGGLDKAIALLQIVKVAKEVQ